jgi:ketosteroid isomerase-like protein
MCHPKRLLWLVVTFLAGCVAVGPRAGEESGPPPANPNLRVAQELRLLQDQWRRALSARDTAFFARVLAEDFVLTGNAGTRTKAGFIRELSGSAGTVPPAQQEETNIRVFGELAVITGLLRYDIPGSSAPVISRYTEVWIKRQNRWLSVHSHHNQVAETGALAPESQPTPP